ncbi:MAG: hypothetical protein GJU76_06960 [Gallionella sp.]|jgi:hypothetical protein|nr:hypothetical protein [Gallionella sp.]
MAQQTYVGIAQDTHAGMTHIGRVIRDAWVFGILPESESCVGWEASRIQNLYEQVYAEWELYGHLPSALPEPLRSRYIEIYERAISKARAAGWDATLGEDD